MSSGPNSEINGTDVVLYVNDINSHYVIVGSQRGVQFKETSAPIDFSSKESRAMRVDHGRYSATASLTHLYVPSASGYTALRNSLRGTGAKINIKRYQLGSAVDTAACIVTGLSEDFPDQGPGVVSVDIQIDGFWTGSGS